MTAILVGVTWFAVTILRLAFPPKQLRVALLVMVGMLCFWYATRLLMIAIQRAMDWWRYR